MKNKLLYFFMLLSLMFVSCRDSDTSNTTKNIHFKDIAYHDLGFEVVCKLDENLSYLDRIVYNFRMVSDSLFLVANGTKVFLYSTDGEQLKKVGDCGNASGEYNRVVMVYSSDNYIYLLCSGKGNILVYSMDGVYIETYKSPHPHSEFIIENDSIVTFYRAFISDNTLVKRYNLKTSELIASSGDTNDADKALLAINNTGAFSQTDTGIIYMQPSKLEFNMLYKNGNTASLFNITDSDFKVDLNFELNSLTNWDFMKENSVVKGAHTYNGAFYILAETGKMSYLDGVVQSNDTRRLNLFEVDENLNPIKQLIFNNRQEFMTPSFFYKNYLYFINLDSEGYYNLCRIKLNNL